MNFNTLLRRFGEREQVRPIVERTAGRTANDCLVTAQLYDQLTGRTAIVVAVP